MSHLDDWVDEQAERREQRLRQLGTRSPRCRSCSEADPLALCGVHPDIRCYECLAAAHGRSVVEGHHVSGRANDPNLILEIPGNDHRVLSAAQLAWPDATLRNPDGSPLLWIVAAIRGWLETLALILDRGVGWIPARLEWLDDALRAWIGPRWWETVKWTL